MKHKTQNKNQRGLTLIELIVAVAVFSLVIVAIVGIFASASKAQRKVFESQNVIDNARFAIEAISRDVRMGMGFSVEGDFDRLNFTDFKGRSVYYCRSNSVGVCSSSGEFISKFDSDSGVSEPITTDLIKITNLSFSIIGGGPDDQQPRITIVFEVVGRSERFAEKSGIIIQTTVSARELES